MESFATPYPVIFFDGKQEQNIGFVGIHSDLNYKRFQSLLSQKAGVPANQLSAVLVCRRAPKATEKRQKLPINGNTNFSIILNQHHPSREKDCHFFVSVKKSKKDRRGPRKRSAESRDPDDWESASSVSETSTFDEKCQSVVDEMLLSEEEIVSFIQGNTSRARKSVIHRKREQRPKGSSNIPHGRFSFDGVAEHNIGKILLRRPVTGPNVASAPRRERTSRVQVLDQTNTQASKADTVIPYALNSHSSHRDHQKTVSLWTREPRNGQRSDYLKFDAPIFLPSDRAYRSYEAVYPDSFTKTISEDPSPKLSSRSLSRSGGLQSGNSYHTISHYPRVPSISPVETAMDIDLRTSHDYLLRMQQSHNLTGEIPLNFLTTSATYGYLQGGNDVETDQQNICCEVCFDCKKRNIAPVPFHWCVRDEVISGFRGPSPAGPIGRPPQTHHVRAAA